MLNIFSKIYLFLVHNEVKYTIWFNFLLEVWTKCNFFQTSVAESLKCKKFSELCYRNSLCVELIHAKTSDIHCVKAVKRTTVIAILAEDSKRWRGNKMKSETESSSLGVGILFS